MDAILSAWLALSVGPISGSIQPLHFTCEIPRSIQILLQLGWKTSFDDRVALGRRTMTSIAGRARLSGRYA